MARTKFMVISDSHGDMQDDSAVHEALRFAAEFKPALRIHAGDAFDFRSIRRAASDDERGESLEADVEMGLSLLSRFKANVWVWGNHDHRIVRAIQYGSRMTADYCRRIHDQILDSLPKTQSIPWGKRRFYQLGQFKVIHGYHAGQYAAKQAAAVYGDVMQGHTHAISRMPSPYIDKPAEGREIGCLCQLDMDYNAGHPNTLRQQHGFAYGWLSSGVATVCQAQRIGDQWIYPTEAKR